MKKIFSIFTAIIMLLLTSCPNVAEKPSTEKTKCDVLMMMYLAADNNLSAAIRCSFCSAQHGLYCLKQNSSDLNIKIVALWDGSANPKYQFGGAAVYPDTKLYELGPKSESLASMNNKLSEINSNNALSDEEKERQSIEVLKKFAVVGEQTKDLTETADFIPKLADGSTEADLSDYNTLQSFMEYCYDHYEYKTSVLHIFGHGAGAFANDNQNIEKAKSRAYCPDETSPYEKHIIGTYQFGNVLEAMYKKSGKKLNCVLLESCLGAGFDELYEIRNFVEYISASANVLMGPSENLENVIPKIQNNSSGKDIAKLFYEEQINYQNELIKDKSIKKGSTLTDKFNSDVEKSNTFGVFDLSKCDEVYASLDKVISELATSSQSLFNYYDPSHDTKKYDYENLTIAKYPFSATYLIDKEHAYLCKRNESGLVGDECTSLFYKGSFHFLYDIGYLMDMLIKTDFASDNLIKSYVKKENSKDEYITTYYESQELSDFKTNCKKVNEALKDMVVCSFRRNCTGADLSSDLYSELQQEPCNYNHYGITICGSDSKISSDSFFVRTDWRYPYWSAFGAKTQWYDVVKNLFP